MNGERLAEIKCNYENACGVAYEYWDYSQGYPPVKALDFGATEDVLDLIDEVERLDCENEKLCNKLALHTLGKRNLGAMVEHKDEEIARLRKALTQIHGVTSHEDNVAIFGDMAEIERIAKEALGNGD